MNNKLVGFCVGILCAALLSVSAQEVRQMLPVPITAALGGTGTQTNPTTGQVLVGGASNAYTPQSLGGDVSAVTAGGSVTLANANATRADLGLTVVGALKTAASGAVSQAGAADLSNGVTGSGAVVLATSPTLTTPALGVATATSIDGLVITTSTGTLTIANGKTFTASNTLTITGTDGSSLAIGSGGTLGTAAFQNTGTSGNTVPLLNGTNTWSNVQQFGSGVTGATLQAYTGGGAWAIYNASLTPGSGNYLLATSGSNSILNAPSGGSDLLTINNANVLALTSTLLTFTDAVNVALGTTTGTQIGTTTAQKLGFWGTAPIVQPTSGTDVLTALSSEGLVPAGILSTADITTGILTQARGGTGTANGAVVTVTKQIFTASGTYTPTTGILFGDMWCVGAGGGSGGAAGSATGTSAAGGGGSGSYARAIKTAAQVGASQTVTIGAGGTAGAAGNNAGGAGGDSSIGALVVGKGGTGGNGAAAGAGALGGAGGVAGTGEITPTGNSGGAGIGGAVTTISAVGGFGAGSFLGGQPSQVSATGACTNGTAAAANTGAGASAGVCSGSAGNASGAIGGSGMCYIVEYVKQ